MICYLNIMYHFEEGLMADERKLNEQPSINKDYYYYYYYFVCKNRYLEVVIH